VEYSRHYWTEKQRAVVAGRRSVTSSVLELGLLGAEWKTQDEEWKIYENPH